MLTRCVVLDTLRHGELEGFQVLLLKAHVLVAKNVFRYYFPARFLHYFPILQPQTAYR